MNNETRGLDTRTWFHRFCSAMSMFTEGEVIPTAAMVSDWFTTDSEELQGWVLDNLKRDCDWMQGIEVIDVCERLADTPREDLRGAEDRLEEFCRPAPPEPPPVTHNGLYPYRLEREDAALERHFVDCWIEENVRGHLLRWLLTPPKAGYPADITQDQATVAATIIQWLGSPVGTEFVLRVLRRQGYTVEPPPRDLSRFHPHMDRV